jgi:hypothetical protein
MFDLEVHAAHSTHPPAPGGMPAPPAFFFGTSATMASVVIRSAATEDAFWIATRTTLVGSMLPFEIRLPYMVSDFPRGVTTCRSGILTRTVSRRCGSRPCHLCTCLKQQFDASEYA